jgi:hypothetical protein
MSELVGVLQEEQRFLEDITLEIEAVINRPEPTPPPPPPPQPPPKPDPSEARKALWKEFADLEIEEQEQIKLYPHLQADIQRYYGKKKDDIRRKLI